MYQAATEQETVARYLQEQPSPSLISWLETERTINEFKRYFSCAFPVLFPTGAADFSAPHIHKGTICKYFKHLLMYDDGRFAKYALHLYS